MKKILLASFSFLVLSTQSSYAEMSVKPYASLKVAAVRADTDNKSYDSGLQEIMLDKTKTDDVYGLRLAAGAAFDVPYGAIRSELEYGYNGQASVRTLEKLDPSEYEWRNGIFAQTLLANAYFDFDTKTDFVPYVGGGVGVSWLKAKMQDHNFGGGDDWYRASNSTTDFAWQLGLGVSYKVASNIVLDCGYRYTDYGSVKTKGKGGEMATKTDYTSNELSLGVRYMF